MTTFKAASFLSEISKWNGECNLVVHVDGTDVPIEGIESEDVKSDDSERVVRIMLKK